MRVRRVSVLLAVTGLLSSGAVGGLARPVAADGGSCPCSLFAGSAVPGVVEDGDYDARQQGIEVGVAFTSDVAGWITAVRFYKGARNTGSHAISVWTEAGGLVGGGASSGETPSGWQTQFLSSPVRITPGAVYVASYHSDFGFYSSDTDFFDQPLDASPLHAIEGRFHYGSRQFPTDTVSYSNYWVDVVFETAVHPAISSYTPAPNAVGVPASTTLSVSFNSVVVSSAPMEVHASDGSLVPGSFNLTNLQGEGGNISSATFRPAAPLLRGVTYTASLAELTNSGGQTTPLISWSFTTAAACPCSLTPADSTPVIPSSDDSQPTVLGTRFFPGTAGVVTGVRFYKDPTNTGQHTGQLWTVDGRLLARGPFVNESDSGWQTMTFALPIPVSNPNDYVVSYYTESGNYSETEGVFDGGELRYDPLVAFEGTFIHGGIDIFPNQTLHAAYYFVEPVFVPNGG
ncbi:MAG TPA: DUF4082 domain-containing protein [Candidatus Dormibacteraeota bacterium]|nr:DUF4082 domain-containing protein [Candidatus Dormibacteraeota bacterium]